MQLAYYVTAFLVGMLRYRAAVDDTYIGLVVYSHALESALLELAGDGGTLREIELTTQCMKTNSTLHKS
jgi:hypothetical protein